jgi:hypothetical protein
MGFDLSIVIGGLLDSFFFRECISKTMQLL